MKTQNTLKLTITGLLIALGVVIPMYSPVRIMLPPASFTLASHAVIFVAMFISPKVALAVAAGTTLGFLRSFGLRSLSELPDKSLFENGEE